MESSLYLLHQPSGLQWYQLFSDAAYVVETREDLDKATKIPGARQIEPFDTPDGGEVVTLKDPLGFPIICYTGSKKNSPVCSKEKLTVNYEDEKPRKGRFHRFKVGPALVHKWGHYGVTYPPGMYQKKHVTESPVTCFFHIDRGLEYTDHHSFFCKCCKPGESRDVAQICQSQYTAPLRSRWFRLGHTWGY
jgi:hypothetical protein